MFSSMSANGSSLLVGEGSTGFLFTLSFLFRAWLSSLCQYSWHSCTGDYFIDFCVFAVGRELFNYPRSAIVFDSQDTKQYRHCLLTCGLYVHGRDNNFACLNKCKFKLCNPVASKGLTKMQLDTLRNLLPCVLCKSHLRLVVTDLLHVYLWLLNWEELLLASCEYGFTLHFVAY